MSPRTRRLFVSAFAALCIALGIVSIQAAARLTEAAAPPPAPPVSLERLRTQLADEQDRARYLEEELGRLITLTADLEAALATTDDQVATDGLTAEQLRVRLADAQARLAELTVLLDQAQARLRELETTPAKTPRPEKTPHPSPTPNATPVPSPPTPVPSP